MNKATLKVDSFAGTNTVLINGQPVGVNSDFINYYAKPIISAAGKILETIEAEFNDEFELDVYGNLYERTFLASVCGEYELCTVCRTHETQVSLSTTKRLGMLGIGAENPVEIPFALITDSAQVRLPQYPGIRFVETGKNGLVVSNDIDFIKANIKGQTSVVFLIGGRNQKIGKTVVIGVEADQAEELVCSYIDSTAINAVINSVARAREGDRGVVLANRTEPYFYADEQIELSCGEKRTLPVRTIPEGIGLDGVTARVNGNSAQVDKLTVEGIAPGKSTVELFCGSPFPFASISASVIQHTFVTDIDIALTSETQSLCEGKLYPISVSLQPKDAEDVDTLAVTVSNPDIAEVQGNKLLVKAPGVFEIVAKTNRASASVSFTAEPSIKALNLCSLPSEFHISDIFELNVEVVPENAYDKRYKWVTSDRSVAVVGVSKDGRELLKATGIGSATIQCISLDDESVTSVVDVKVVSAMEKDEKNGLVRAGTILTILTYVCLFFFPDIYWLALLAAAGATTISLFTCKNKKTMLIPFIALIVSLLLRPII